MLLYIFFFLLILFGSSVCANVVRLYGTFYAASTPHTPHARIVVVDDRVDDRTIGDDISNHHALVRFA